MKNIIKHFIKKYRFYLNLIGVSFIIIGAFFVISCISKIVNTHSVNYWNMLWTAFGAMSVPTSLFIFLKTKQRQDLQEVEAAMSELIIEEIPKFWADYRYFKYIKCLKPQVEYVDLEHSLLSHGLSILQKIKTINPPETEIDPYLLGRITLVLTALKDYQNEIERDIPELGVMFDKYGQ